MRVLVVKPRYGPPMITSNPPPSLTSHVYTGLVVTPAFTMNWVAPSSQMTALTGCPIISGRSLTVRVTAFDVIGGGQIPLTIT